MNTNSKKIAVFDLDGTITNKDTYLEFIKYSRGKTSYYFGLLMLSPVIVAFYLKLISNSVLKEKFFSYFFKRQAYQKTKNDGEAFSENEIPKYCRLSALKVLEWHESQNHDILILSASAKLWLQKWCAHRNYELICTEFEVIDNKITGKLKGENCFGKRKKVVLSEYFKENQYTYSFGYGDSSADSYFLELVDEPYLMELTSQNVHKNWKAPSTTLK